MSIKHFFASANTGVGFVNLFQNINEGGFTYVIKGGSGTGKSSLMKKVGEHFSLMGFDVEFFHCSTDVESLDGVRIVQKNIAIVDGTLPHVCEVKFPQVDGKILNVGNFVDEQIKSEKEEIQKIYDSKNLHYKNMYDYLKFIYDLQKINQKNHKNFENNVFFEENIKILKKVNAKEQNKIGKIRELFFDALQENGFVNFAGINNFKNVFELKKDMFCLNQQLGLLKQNFYEMGYEVIALKNSVMPELLSAVVVTDLDVIIFGNDMGLDSEIFLDNNDIIKKLLSLASKTILKAKNEHKKLEEIFIKHMNFKMVDKLTKNLIGEIEKNKNKKW